jgi:hypothetical protein
MSPDTDRLVEGVACTIVCGPTPQPYKNWHRYTLDVPAVTGNSQSVLLRMVNRGFTKILECAGPDISAVFLWLDESFKDLFDEQDIQHAQLAFSESGLDLIVDFGINGIVPPIDPVEIEIQSSDDE